MPVRKKLEFRQMTEADLSAGERAGVYGRQSAAAMARDGRERVVAMARRDRDGWQAASRWVVATCRVGREDIVSDSLGAAQIECWCPRERWRKPPRRGMPAVEIFLPIFRGYLFARVVPDSEAYAGLLAAAPLKGLMMQGGRPYIMPERLMDALMLSAVERERKQQDSEDLPPMPKIVGRRVTIRSGPFADLTVTVRQLLSRRREVVVDVPFFGGMTEARIGIDSVLIRD